MALTRRRLFGLLASTAVAAPLVVVSARDVEAEEWPEFDEPLGQPMTHAELAAAFRAREADARAEGYRAGHDTATLRAEARAELGLPITYGSTGGTLTFVEGELTVNGNVTITASLIASGVLKPEARAMLAERRDLLA